MSGCHEVISCNTHVSNFHAAALYCNNCTLPMLGPERVVLAVDIRVSLRALILQDRTKTSFCGIFFLAEK